MSYTLEELGTGVDAVTLIVDGVQVKCGINFKLPNRETAKDLIICTNLGSVPRHTFLSWKNLKRIWFPPSLTETGDDLCINAEEVVLHEGLSKIGMAFCLGNPHVRSVRLPSTVTSIQNRSFSYCTCLEDLALPDGLSEIGHSALSGLVACAKARDFCCTKHA